MNYLKLKYTLNKYEKKKRKAELLRDQKTINECDLILIDLYEEFFNSKSILKYLL